MDKERRPNNTFQMQTPIKSVMADFTSGRPTCARSHPTNQGSERTGGTVEFEHDARSRRMTNRHRPTKRVCRPAGRTPCLVLAMSERACTRCREQGTCFLGARASCSFWASQSIDTARGPNVGPGAGWIGSSTEYHGLFYTCTLRTRASSARH